MEEKEVEIIPGQIMQGLWNNDKDLGFYFQRGEELLAVWVCLLKGSKYWVPS